MGIYFRDILLIRISRGTSNCVQRVFEKNIYFIMIFPPHFKFLLSNERLDFCDVFFFLNKRSKGLTMQIIFLHSPLIIFTKGANIFGHDCVYILALSND